MNAGWHECASLVPAVTAACHMCSNLICLMLCVTIILYTMYVNLEVSKLAC